ncbi:MAG: hypothetical protein JWP97_4692 [Labilithrix sp.]|nr:hypothetical protein [Labilithrix sp.]
MTRKILRFFAPLALAGAACLSAGDAQAGDTTVSLGEVSDPPATLGVDLPAFKNAAEGELRGVDLSKLRKRRNVLVSVAVIGAAGAPFGCTVNALLRDAKTGTMLAIIEGQARVEGSPNAALRREVLRAALRNAVKKIPEALAGN